MGAKELQKERELMVSTQLVRRGIRDQRVLSAMREVPRHEFVPPDYRHRAYDDSALPIEARQTISQPYMVAVMTELLELTGTETVLEVGTGTGYQSAVLSRLAGSVYTMDRIGALSEPARQRLARLGYGNVEVFTGDGSKGLPEHAPYDRILVTAGAPELPGPLIEQLAGGGIIVIPVGSESSQSLLRVRKINGELIKDYHTPCIFVPLVGEHAWPEDMRFRKQ